MRFLFFIVNFSWFFFLHLTQWPGIISSDNIDIYMAMVLGEPLSGWRTFIFDAYLRLLWSIHPTNLLPAVLQFVLVSFVFSSLLFWIYQKGYRKVSVILNLLLLLYPTVSWFGTWIHREVIYAFIFIHFVFTLYRYKNKTFHNLKISLLMGLELALLSILRQDGILVVFSSVFVFYFVYKFREKILYLPFVVALIGVGSYQSIIRLSNLENVKVLYEVTSYLMPIAFVTSEVEDSEFQKEPLLYFSNFFDLEGISNNYSPYTVATLLKPELIKQPLNEVSLSEFRIKMIDLLFRYPILFLKQKIEFIFLMFFPAPEAYRYYNNVLKNENFQTIFEQKLLLNAESVFPVLEKPIESWLLFPRNNAQTSWMGGCFLSFLLCLLGVLSFKKTPATAALGFVTLIRLLPFLLLSTGVHVYYFFSLLFIGLLVPFFWWFEKLQDEAVGHSSF